MQYTQETIRLYRADQMRRLADVIIKAIEETKIYQEEAETDLIRMEIIAGAVSDVLARFAFLYKIDVDSLLGSVNQAVRTRIDQIQTYKSNWLGR